MLPPVGAVQADTRHRCSPNHGAPPQNKRVALFNDRRRDELLDSEHVVALVELKSPSTVANV